MHACMRFTALLLTLHSSGKWDRSSRGLLETAIKRGWCTSESDFKEKFKFKENYSEFLFATFGQGMQKID